MSTIKVKRQMTKLSRANWDAIINKIFLISKGYIKQENKFEYNYDKDIKYKKMLEIHFPINVTTQICKNIWASLDLIQIFSRE